MRSNHRFFTIPNRRQAVTAANRDTPAQPRGSLQTGEDERLPANEQSDPRRLLLQSIVAIVMAVSCTEAAGTVVFGWGSEEPTGTTYEVIVDGRRVTRIVTAGREAADIEDAEGIRRKSNAPVQVHLTSGSHLLEVIKNGKPHLVENFVRG